MKKIILIILSFLSISIVKAQDKKTNNIKFGVKGGLNLSYPQIGGEYGFEYNEISSRTGFHLGGFAQIKVSKKFIFQPELLINNIGIKTSYSENGSGGYHFTDDSKFNLTYISIPLIEKFSIYDGLSLEGGPQLGFITKGAVESQYSETHLGQVYYHSEIYNNFKTIDFGLNIGASYEIENNLVFSARYYFGLEDVSKLNKTEYNPSISYKNNSFQLSVGYLFK